jgi:hypothetical protein
MELMKTLTSISPIDKKYETIGSSPFRILASDMEHYICKYPFFPNDSKLINEFLGNRFASVWGIDVADMVAIQVSREHLPEELLNSQLNYNAIKNPIVGFKQIEDVVEIKDSLSEGINQNDLSQYDKEAFLQIALFDIWLSNDDRNCGNTNVLIKTSEKRFSPIAMDHEKIFNSSDLGRGIFELNYEDSLFYSKLFHRLLKKSNRSYELIDSVSASLQSKIEKCNHRIDEILKEIPQEWNIDQQLLKNKLEDNIFTEEWVLKVERTFRAFASRTILKR